MSDGNRTFILKLANKDVKNGRIPLSVFMKTVQSIQKTIYAVGNAQWKGEPTSQGRRPVFIEQQCELFFVKAEPGSLLTELALPEKNLDLASELPDFGEKVLSDFKGVLRSVLTNDPKSFKNIVKVPKCQKQVIDNVYNILPSDKEDYELFFSLDEPKTLIKINRPAPEIKNTYVDHQLDEELEPDLYELEELRATILAKMDNQSGEIMEVKKVLDFERLEDLRPYRASTLVYKDREYIFQHEIVCTIIKEDGYVVVQYSPLDIETYAETREDAIEDFKEEFALIWDSYGIEDDSNLTRDAIELKKKLRGLVKGVEIRGYIEDIKN